MSVFYDQLNREVLLPAMPKRIVSVVPSQTELLFALGLGDKVVGITKFCIHPENRFKSTAKVGGTKQLDIEKIKALRPDLIIANKEENERSQVEELMAVCPVWISDINDLDSAVEMIERVGELTGTVGPATALGYAIKQQFEELSLPLLNLRVAYFIWRKPYMVAGKHTFIDAMLQKCGLVNVFELERYPEIDAAMLVEAKPDVVFLSSEPYPFKQKHIDELNEIVPNAVIKLVDGEMFSWYGSRLLLAAGYFREVMGGIIGIT